METETVELPKGLWAEIQNMMSRLPASAFGTTPLGTLEQFSAAVRSGRVIEPEDQDGTPS